MASLAEKRILVDADEPATDPQARPEELRLLRRLGNACAAAWKHRADCSGP